MKANEIQFIENSKPVYLKLIFELYFTIKCKVQLVANLVNTPTGASTNPKNFDFNKNLSLNLL